MPAGPATNDEGTIAMLSLATLLTTLAYAFLGLAIFVIGFRVWDRLTPVDVWKEIAERQNVALAILAGSVAIALAIIIGAAVHG